MEKFSDWLYPYFPYESYSYPHHRRRYFYIFAARNGWPFEKKGTLCKFGVTRQDPAERRKQHERDLSEYWGLNGVDLILVFLGEGRGYTEDPVQSRTENWTSERFHKDTEWRLCSPRQLARVAVIEAERRVKHLEGGHPIRKTYVIHLEPLPSLGGANLKLPGEPQPGVTVLGHDLTAPSNEALDGK